MYIVFMDLEKAYDRVNREALRQVLRMYDVGDKIDKTVLLSDEEYRRKH